MVQVSPPLTRLPEAPRILLVRFSSLGDVVKTTGLPRMIRAAYPKAHLTMVTAGDFLPLIADNPHLNEAIGLDRRAGWGVLAALRRRLAAQPWDLIADVHKSLRSRWLCAALRGPRSAYSKHTLQRWLLLHFRLNSFHPPTGKEQDFAEGLRPYGIVDDKGGTEIHLERVSCNRETRERLGKEWKAVEAWREKGRPVLGIAPVAAWALKKWPLAHFRSTVQGFVKNTGGGVVLFGGPGDREVEAVVEGLGKDVVSLVARTSLLESALFASQADVVVANDTGMLHLSEAVGTPVVALFGPTSRELGYYPVLSRSHAIELDLPCRPCSKNGQGRCRHPYPLACLEGISPQAVLRRVAGVLEQREAN